MPERCGILALPEPLWQHRALVVVGPWDGGRVQSLRIFGSGVVIMLGLCITLAAPVEAPQPAAASHTKIDVSKLGPQVGQKVPDFSLADQTGTV